MTGIIEFSTDTLNIEVSGINDNIPIDLVEVISTGQDVYVNVETAQGVLAVNGRAGFVTLNKSDVGLSNVENISITGVSGYLQGQINNIDVTSKLTGVSGYLQNQINNLDLNYASDLQLSQTGSALQSQINNLYNSGFITGVDLSPYYLKSNPSGFITGVDLSNYATLNNLASTGQNLQNQINNLDNVYATDTSLAQTGQFLDQKIDTFSGTYQNFVNNLDSNYASQSEFNTLSGNLNSTGQNLDGKMNSLSGAAVLVYGNQTISGVKNFIDKPRYQNSQVYIESGTSANIPEGGIVYVPQFDDINTLNFDATLVYISSSGLLRLPTGAHNLSFGQTQYLNILITGPGMNGGTFYVQNPTYAFVGPQFIQNGWENIYETKSITHNYLNLYKKPNSLSWTLNKNKFLTDLEDKNQYFVNTTGNQGISGTKIFRDQVYIKDLYVTGTQTIVNTTNTNVGNNYILLNATGGAIDAGIFIVTGSGLTGISNTGAVIGYDVPANRWVFGNTSRDADLSQLDQIAGITDITNYSGFVSSNFYSVNNPNGYITGIENIVYTTGNQSINGLKTFLDNIETYQIKSIAGQFVGNSLTLIGGDGASFGGPVIIRGGTGANAGGNIQLNSTVSANRGTNKSLGIQVFRSGEIGESSIDIDDTIFNVKNGLTFQISGVTVDPSNYYTKDNPSGFITGVDTSNFYTKDNPSGFITGLNVDLSSYATTGQLNQASGNLQSQIDILNVNSIAYAIALG